ncbi:MAG: DMT family transporter [Coriobacteriia bacterium]|nr:DMT family transporter [Coriobacteriia bacterium]
MKPEMASGDKPQPLHSGTRPHPLRSSLVLLATAGIWGFAFVAQRVGMGYIGPFLFAGMRFCLGAAVLSLVLLVKGTILKPRREELALGVATKALPLRQLAKSGLVCAFFLFMGSSLQQVGLVFTSASKAGFLTALYIVLVPILGAVIGQRISWNAWLGAVVAVAGLYFMSITDQLDIIAGDLILIVGALFWAGHILAVDRYVGDIGQDELYLVCIAQFLAAGIASFALTPLLDRFFVESTISIAGLKGAFVPILYAGVLSTGLAYTLQAVGQQGLPASAAAIIMSLEAVFSMLGGAALLHESLTSREVVGCSLMFAAVIIAQLPQGWLKRLLPKGTTGDD